MTTPSPIFVSPTFGLTWFEALVLAVRGSFVRREGMGVPPDLILVPLFGVIDPSSPVMSWICYQNGLWYACDQNKSLMRVIAASDFQSADYQADDWTTDPVGTVRDTCKLPAPVPIFVPPSLSLSLSIGSGTLTAILGSSSPAGSFQLEFFLNGVSVALTEAVSGATTISTSLPSSGTICVSVVATSRLPLPAWTASVYELIFIPPPSFAVNTGADGTTVNVAAGAAYSSLGYSVSYGAGADSAGLTIHNPLSHAVTLTIVGSCDDDVKFNGMTYEPDSYNASGVFTGIYGHGTFLNGGGGGFGALPVGHQNVTHAFTYTVILAPGDSLEIQGQDNFGGGGITCTVAVS